MSSPMVAGLSTLVPEERDLGATIIDMGGAEAKLGEIARAASGRVNDTIRYDLHADPDASIPLTGGRVRTEAD